MKIYVIRHAQTDSNKNGIAGDIEEDINETGVQQCLEAREKVKNLDIDLIISSPARRTKHVTEIINVNNIPVIYDERIIERELGIYETFNYKDIDRVDFWNYNPKKYLDLELMKDLCDRVNDFIEDIKNKYSDKKILVVTHGGITRGFYCHSFGIPEDGNLADVGQKNCEIKEYEI